MSRQILGRTMRIKYYQYQKWMILVLFIIPIVVCNLGLYKVVISQHDKNQLNVAEGNMDRAAEQVYIKLNGELEDLKRAGRSLEVMGVNSFAAFEKYRVEEEQQLYWSRTDKYWDAFFKSNPLEGAGILYKENEDVIILYAVMENGEIIAEYYTTPAFYEFISTPQFTTMITIDSVQLGEAEDWPPIVKNHLEYTDTTYYKTYSYDEYGIELSLKTPKNLWPIKPISNLSSIFIGSILGNLLLYVLISISIKKVKHPMAPVISLLESLKEGHMGEVLFVKGLSSDDAPLNQTVMKVIHEIRETEKMLNEQMHLLESSCAHYKQEIEAITIKSKTLKKEHDTYFEEMSTKESLNDTLFNFVSQIVFRLDSEGNIIEVNHAFENRLGFKKDEIVGISILKLLVDKNKTFDALNKVSEESVFINFKMGGFNSNASQYLNIKIEELPNGSYLYIGKSVNDEITLQSRILRKNRELEYINQINSSLISNWGVSELLVNIIRRIDYLFNIVTGIIRIRNDGGNWELKAQTEKGNYHHEAEVTDYKRIYNVDLVADSEIQLIDLTEAHRELSKYPDELKHILFAPMEVEGEIIAIMEIGLESPMTANDLNILKMFKNQASVVIQRALLYDELRKQYFNTIQALVNVIEAKDKYTEGHSRRVSRFSVEIAHEMGYSNEELENIEIAGLLHDVGKVGIHQSILTKQGKLSQEEYEIIKQHPEKGIQILASIKLDQKIVEGILYHHVRYDLRGYPTNHNLSELPPYASIIGTADALDAITSERSYSRARTIKEGLEELIRHKGTQFHPETIEALIEIGKRSPEKLQIIIDDE